MHTCIIVDDLQQFVDLLKDYALKIPQLSIMLATTDSIEALTFLDNNKPDIVFLDIEMPGISGIEFTRNIKAKWGNNMPKIVFTTGHPQYALDGYEHGVADYLLKPIIFSRFKQCTDRLIDELNKRGTPAEKQAYFFADDAGEKVRIDVEDIVYIEAAGNYITIATNQSCKTIYKSMNAMQEFLPQDKFIRIHKSYLVAISKIRTVKRNEITIKLNNAEKSLPLGLKYKGNVLKQLGVD